MKTLLRKKWFRRFCQTLLALVSLLALTYVFIDWRGARMKRDVIAEMRAAGRPTSIAETLKPLPREEDNFAMVPILAQAREEWWNDKSNGSGKSPDQARVRLDKMTFKSGKKAFVREGTPDLSIWKQNLELSGTDAECLEAYDRKFGDILAELRAGMSRSETVSPMMHRLAARSQTDWASFSGENIPLTKVSESLGFRAELALAAGRPELALESLLIAFRLSELIGSEEFLINQLLRDNPLRTTQPILARALQTAGWNHSQISSIRNEFAELRILDGYRRALDLENLTSFALFEGTKIQPRQHALVLGDTPGWKRDFLNAVVTRLPIGWYQGIAALRTRQGIRLREDLGEGDNLQSWFQACLRSEQRGKSASSWESWIFSLPGGHFFFGNWFNKVCRSQTLVQQAMLACDLETYRLDHGRYPERLQEIGGSVIVDSMTGEPFIYRLTDSGYLLYSIGSDGKDNEGDRSKQHTHNKQDWVW